MALTDVLHRFLQFLQIFLLTVEGALLECIDMNSELAVKSCSWQASRFFFLSFVHQAFFLSSQHLWLIVCHLKPFSLTLERKGLQKWHVAETYHIWKPLLFHHYWSHEKVWRQIWQVEEKDLSFIIACSRTNKALKRVNRPRQLPSIHLYPIFRP